MSYPIKVCVICHEEFELKPGKPGFANRCPDCSTPEDEPDIVRRAQEDPLKGDGEATAARKKAIRDMLYRKDS